MIVKLDFKLLAGQALDIVRIISPAALTGTVFALASKLISGEPAEAWLSSSVTVWFASGCLQLAKQPPSSIREAGRLLVRASIWPWYLYCDSSLSFFDKQDRLRASFLAMLFFPIGEFIENAPTLSQLPPLVRSFVSLVQPVGLLATLGWACLALGDRPLQYILTGLFWRCVLLVLGISVISYFSSDVSASLQWIQANPASALTALAAVAFVWFLFNLASLLPGTSIPRQYEYAKAAGTVGNFALKARREPTERDNRVTCVHEAGHALVYASLGSLPDEFKIVVHDQSTFGVLGFVSSLEMKDMLTSRAFSEWKMLVLLAGQAAEGFLLAETSLGARSDMDKWQIEAKRYLSNGFCSTYFNPPENQFEVCRNQVSLDSLRANQRTLLQHFFRENKQVLEDLAAAINDKRELTKSDLIPFLTRVKFVDNFPKPNGEFTEFNSD
jgi:Peptidase family M41